MTDWYTDELFGLRPDLATTVAFPVSRIVVDPEQFVDDSAEPMARKGMGVIYERKSSGQPLRRPPSAPERAKLLARFYEPHHAASRDRNPSMSSCSHSRRPMSRGGFPPG